MSTLPPLQRQRASDSVYEALRSAILARTFGPGQRLNVNALAQQLGVSLTPVKDALTRLEAESLIEIRPRSGTFVSAVSPDDLAEAFEIRCALECLAAEKALPRATASDIQALRTLAEAIAERADDEEARRRHEGRNIEFHRRIVALSGNNRLQQMYESLDAHIQIARIHHRHGDWTTRLASERQEHLAIVAAFADRDATALVGALRHHIMRAADSLVHDLRDLASRAAASAMTIARAPEAETR